MLSGHQGADEVQPRAGHTLQVLLGVIPLVEDQGQIGRAAGQLAAAHRHLLDERPKGGRVMLVAGIAVMQQRDLPVGRDHQSKADDAQVIASLLAVAALRQGRSQIEAIDKGEEVGGIEQQAAQVQTKLHNRGAHQRRLNAPDVLLLDPAHVVPEALTRKLFRAHAEERGQHGLRIPRAQLRFTAGSDTAVQRRDKQILADRDTVGAALGDDSIDGADHIELAGDRKTRRRGTELTHHGALRPAALQPLHQVCRRAQVLLPDDFRLTLDALALAQVVVRAPADDFLRQGRHELGHTLTTTACQASIRQSQYIAKYRDNMRPSGSYFGGDRPNMLGHTIGRADLCGKQGKNVIVAANSVNSG